MPDISVIIPNYNHAGFLLQRIESVCNQTYPSFEVILLDDNSTDNSREIIATFQGHEKVSHIVYNEHNAGAFRQWKRGIELARGKYIWIAESDDVADPDFLASLMQPFKDDSVILSYCRSRLINANGDNIGLHCWMDKLDNVRWKKDYVADAGQEVKNYLRYRNTICNASSVVFKKMPGLEELIPVDMEFCGDWLFWKRFLGQKGKIAYTHKALSSFRDHSQTTRAVSTIDRELKRHNEYVKFITPTKLHIFEHRYDWMFREWLQRRHLLPVDSHELSFSLRVRYQLVSMVWHACNYIKKAAKSLPSDGLLFKSLKTLNELRKANT